MGIGSSIWYCYAATPQPNGVQPYSFPLCFLQTILYAPDISALSAARCSFWEKHAGIAPEQESTDASNASIPAAVHSADTRGPQCQSEVNIPASLPVVAIPQFDVTVVQDGETCPVCAISADVPCYSCSEKFCPRHIFQCTECRFWFCGNCFDLHNVEGHWSDSDTATALAGSFCGCFENAYSKIVGFLLQAQPQEAPVSPAKTKSILTAVCKSTFDQTLFLPLVQRLFSILTRGPVEVSR